MICKYDRKGIKVMKVVYYKSRATCFTCVDVEHSKNESGDVANVRGFNTKTKDNQKVFSRNNEELLSDNGDNISEEKFKSMIKSEIKRYFNPFDNIVVLAGAGASIVNDNKGKPDRNYGHTVQMLAVVIDELLENEKNLYSVKEMSNICHYAVPISNVINGQGEQKKKYNDEFVLEDFLSKVITYEEFFEGDNDKLKYINTKNKILEIIKEKTSFSFDVEKHKHSSLIKTMSSTIKSPNRLTIITTNYDTLFEQAASYLNFTVFDGFSFDAYPKFDIDLFDWSLVKPISNVKSDKVEYKKSTLNLLKIHGSLTWKKEGDDIVRVNKEINNEPIMIFPSSNKYSHSYEKPYFELFSKFQEILKRPNTLFITTGFSFSDSHIAKMITQAIKSTPSLSVLVTDLKLDSNEKSSNWHNLEKLMADGYRIAFLKATLASDLIDYFGEVSNDN